MNHVGQSKGKQRSITYNYTCEVLPEKTMLVIYYNYISEVHVIRHTNVRKPVEVRRNAQESTGTNVSLFETGACKIQTFSHKN